MKETDALALENTHNVLVDLHDVWVAYDGKWVLKSIFFKCYSNEIVGIVGPNGGGKTTLLNIILGLVRPSKGSVQVFGHPPGKRSRLEIGYLPQVSHADRSFPVTVLDVDMDRNRVALSMKKDTDPKKKRPPKKNKKTAFLL